jgi:hypothetical protein
VRYIWLKQTDGELLKSCRVDTYRASGPGGQKRNKTSSAVRLSHLPSGISVIAEESRSQHENKARALRRLRLAIALQVRSEWVTKEEPLYEAQTRNSMAEKMSISTRNPDYPLVVGVVLDTVSFCDGQISEAARCLGCSTGQLSKFLVSHPKVHAAVNELRSSRGLKPLRN